ncbi:MAG: CYCXC family (seleno)protein [Acidobacteriaceae bacterium]
MRTRFWMTVIIALICVAANAQWTEPSLDIPAFHQTAPAKSAALPPILRGKELTGINFELPWQVKVYQDAAKIPNVLYQLPCYCHCDRALGHTSLRSCFTGLHAAECGTCAKEGFYAYEMTRKGWTPKRIRAAIERGDWQKIDLAAEGAGSHPPSKKPS